MGHWLKWRFLWMFIRKSAGMLMNGQCCASIFLRPTSSFISKEYFSISYCYTITFIGWEKKYHIYQLSSFSTTTGFNMDSPLKKYHELLKDWAWPQLVFFFISINPYVMRVLNSSIMLSDRWRFQIEAKLDCWFVDNAENGAHLVEMGRV